MTNVSAINLIQPLIGSKIPKFVLPEDKLACLALIYPYEGIYYLD